MDDDEVGDVTDISAGTDFKVVFKKESFGNGNTWLKPTATLRRNSSALSASKKDIAAWLKDLPDPVDEYTKFTKEEIKEKLTSYLENLSKGSASSEESKSTSSEGIVRGSKTGSKATKPFDDEEEEEEDSDLPWENKSKGNSNNRTGGQRKPSGAALARNFEEEEE